jgi:hypothetical protein
MSAAYDDALDAMGIWSGTTTGERRAMRAEVA